MTIRPDGASHPNHQHPIGNLTPTNVSSTLSQPVITREQREDVPSFVANTAATLFGTQPTSPTAQGLADRQTSLIKNYVHTPSGIHPGVVLAALNETNTSELKALMKALNKTFS